jgi:hypothetical protein
VCGGGVVVAFVGGYVWVLGFAERGGDDLFLAEGSGGSGAEDTHGDRVAGINLVSR